VVGINTHSAIKNEPVFSNVRGTIAMAKTSDPDSATSQWFFNTVDNSNALDIKSNSGGFTVFGQVLDNGMDVITEIEGLKLCNSIPTVDISFCTDPAGAENYVTIYQIVIVDSSSATAANLNPPKNTLVNSGDSSGSSSSGGGSMAWVSLLSLAIFSMRRKIKLVK